jgi:small-conductance mechanosensitive channel/CRP-like cAMP-binding protein
MLLEELRELLSEFRALPASVLLGPGLIFLVYIAISQFLRARARREGVRTFVLLADTVAYPTFLIVLESLVSDLPHSGITLQSVQRLLWSLLILSAAWIATRLLRHFVWRGHFTRRYGSEAPKILQALVGAGIYFVALAVIVVLVFQRSASGVLVSTGVIVGILGLALQNLLADLFSGITITVEQPFGIGDWLRLSDGTEGEVTEITWQATYLRSFNSSLVIVPNNRMANGVLQNLSRPSRSYAIWISVYVDPRHDPEVVRRLLSEAALSCSAVRKNPPPAVNISDGSGNPIHYIVYVYFADYLAHYRGKNDLYMSIHAYLRRWGITTSSSRYEVDTREAVEQELHLPTMQEEIRNTEIFRMLTEEQIEVLTEHASYHTYYPEQTLVREGDRDTSLFIITSGVVQVTRRDAFGHATEVARLGSGEFLGEMSLLTGEARTATATALLQTTVIIVPKEGLEPILHAVPELSDRFAEVMVDRRLNSEQFVSSMRQSNKPAAAFLREQVDRFVHSIRQFFRL